MLLTDELVAEWVATHTVAADLTEEQMAHIDPLNPFGNGAAKIQQHYDHLASRAVDHAHFIFNDVLLALRTDSQRLDRDEMLQMFREQMFKATTLHEIKNVTSSSDITSLRHSTERITSAVFGRSRASGGCKLKRSTAAPQSITLPFMMATKLPGGAGQRYPMAG